ncbi:MAG: phenylacetate--CoA ligase family protein, partial [Acidobacteriota bacterium]
PDGRRIGRLDPVFKADLPLLEAQIVQERLDQVRLRVVPAAGFDDATAEALRRRLAERLGDDVTIEIERVERLERGPGGKLRAVIGMGS